MRTQMIEKNKLMPEGILIQNDCDSHIKDSLEDNGSLFSPIVFREAGHSYVALAGPILEWI